MTEQKKNGGDAVPLDYAAANILVHHLSRVELNPGDVIVVRCNNHLSDAGYRRLRATVNVVFPNNRTIILEDGLELGVIGANHEAGQE